MGRIRRNKKTGPRRAGRIGLLWIPWRERQRCRARMWAAASRGGIVISLEEVSDAKLDVGLVVLDIIGITGVEVHQAVVIADGDLEGVHEVHADTAADQDIHLAVIGAVSVVVDILVAAVACDGTFNFGLGSQAVLQGRSCVDEGGHVRCHLDTIIEVDGDIDVVLLGLGVYFRIKERGAEDVVLGEEAGIVNTGGHGETAGNGDVEGNTGIEAIRISFFSRATIFEGVRCIQVTGADGDLREGVGGRQHHNSCCEEGNDFFHNIQLS